MSARPAPVRSTAELFVRGLSLVYAVAFVSFWVQMEGLVGSGGILPAHRYLEGARAALGPAAYLELPTLAWLSAGDVSLHAICALGTALACLNLAGRFSRAALLGQWALYLSLVTVGQGFMEYQWDNLLLEAGLAASLIPGSWMRTGLREGPPTAVLWLARWLLVKVSFQSGAAKLLSGDPAWQQLTALGSYFETQPLPPWTAWAAHHLPPAAHQAATTAALGVEIVVPVLIFLSRPTRLWAAAVLAAFQLVIAGTGNFGFLNLLALGLCVPLLDDPALRRWPWRSPVPPPLPPAPRSVRPVATLLAASLIVLGLAQTAGLLLGRDAWPAPAEAVLHRIAPIRSVNRYALFGTMTPTRFEIVVEGSRDGRVWHPYPFRWKPGDPTGRPGFAFPHLPRLDWQMWFAAQSHVRDQPWFLSFLRELLEGSPDVLRLLEEDPFGGRPPRVVRARLYEYRFSDAGTLLGEGVWWERTLRFDYVESLR